MEAQGDDGTVRHRRKLVVLGTALPAASEAGHCGYRLAPTGKVLPTRLPRSGLALQLQLPFQVSFLGFGLVAAAPDGPCDDENGFDPALDQTPGNTTDLLE
jgi:hypothetical protein